MFVDNGWSLPLGLGQDNVREVLAGGDHADLLKVVVRHLTDTTLTSVNNRSIKNSTNNVNTPEDITFSSLGSLLGFSPEYLTNL